MALDASAEVTSSLKRESCSSLARAGICVRVSPLETAVVHAGDGFGPRTQLFEDRVMKTGTVRIGARTSIGARSIVLYHTDVGDDATIDRLSLVMKGEVLADGTRWAVSPVRPR